MTDGGPRKTVYILESDAELAQLMSRVLTSAGYRADHGVPNPAAANPLSTRAPDLLIVAISGFEGTLLAAMRENPFVKSIPVLAVAPEEHLATGPLAGYNIRGTLQMPFDLDDFLDKVEEVLALPHLVAGSTPAPEHTSLATLAAGALAEESRAAVFRWVQQLRQESPWRERTDLKLYELLDSMPVLVDALVSTLRTGNPEEVFSASPGRLSRIREHAELRRNQGFPVVKVIHEYTALRDALMHVLWEHLPRQVPSDEVLTVARAFNLTLDRITEQTIAYYFGAQGPEPPLAQQR